MQSRARVVGTHGRRQAPTRLPPSWIVAVPVGRVVLVRLVVLAQQVLPVIVAVRGAHDGVHVLAGRYGAVARQRNGSLVVELDQDDRTVHAVVEDRVRPYYEKAMVMRSMENTIYFASVNYALRFQESATSLIAPSGECRAYLPYGQEGVLVQAIEVEEATGLLAARYAPERYRDLTPQPPPPA